MTEEPASRIRRPAAPRSLPVSRAPAGICGGLGFTGAAREIALGLLDALAAPEGDYDGDQVLNYAGEDLAHAYGWGVREQLRAAGAPLPDDE